MSVIAGTTSIWPDVQARKQLEAAREVGHVRDSGVDDRPRGSTRPASVATLKGSVVVPTVGVKVGGVSVPGDVSWISVPDTKLKLWVSDDSRPAGPKFASDSVSGSKPFPVTVMVVPPVSLANVVGSDVVVEIEVIVGFGT